MNAEKNLQMKGAGDRERKSMPQHIWSDMLYLPPETLKWSFLYMGKKKELTLL